MVLSEDKIRRYIRRLYVSRMRIMCKHAFFGLLLTHIKFMVDEQLDTACTDGISITFGTEFLESLNDKELDFVLMHEILHVVLQHWSRQGKFEHELYNQACDIVVNSIILYENDMQLESITLRKYGVSQHIAPDGTEGHLHSVEEVYQMLMGMRGVVKKCSSFQGKIDEITEQVGAFWDNHSKWAKRSHDEILKDTWNRYFENACESIAITEANRGYGMMPLFAKRMLQELRKPQIDWRMVLNEFVQEDIVDYSFLPPDRRFADCAFFLPDFYEKADCVKDILFMIDTSASMSIGMITAAYSEIKGAIDQFDGALKGWLGFFDAEVIPPKPFESETEFKSILPSGGGGTRFDIIFEYVRTYMRDNLPTSIIILTDGFAKFPLEEASMEIPVLWLLNNETVTPPWGRVGRIHV